MTTLPPPAASPSAPRPGWFAILVKAWLPVLLVAGIGLGITGIAYLIIDQAEEQRVLRGLGLRVDWRANDFRSKEDDARDALVATAIHIAAKPEIRAEEFQHFTTELRKTKKYISALDWVPLIKNDQREAFEKNLGYSIQEMSPDGTRILAGTRDEYLPIQTQTQFEAFASVVGFDLASEPTRRRAAAVARDTATPQSVLLPVPLTPASQVATIKPTYITFWPIYHGIDTPPTAEQRRTQLRGYVVGVFRIADVLREAMVNTPEAPETIDFYLGNDTPGEDPGATERWVARYSPADRSIHAAEEMPPPPSARYRFSRSFNVPGLHWRMESTFSSAATAIDHSIGPATILIAGLLLTPLLAALVGRGSHQLFVIRALVDRRTAELRQTNTKLNALIDASPHPIVCLDARERVIIWSRAAEELFGYQEEEVIGRPYPLILPEEQVSFANRLLRVANGDVLRNTVSRRRHKDGSIIETSSSASAFYDSDGILLGVIFLIEDVRERNKVQNQLRQAQKMEAIGQLTGGLAHDFNNLLGIVLGNLDLLAEEFQPGQPEHDLTDAAIQAATRGAELTRQLLAFSRRQPLSPKLIYLPNVLEETTHLLRRSLGENITLQLRVSETIWPLRIDVSQLESAIVNLAVNARDAMPNGGRLTIEASNTTVDGRTADLSPETVAGDYVQIVISDTGSGMTEEVMARAFEPFFTTKAAQGTGLGLSMVHGFVRQSGGHTKIYSEPGRGTTIRIYLPRAEGGQISVVDNAPTSGLPGGSELILVVEDNKGLREISTRQLQTLGYRVVPAADAAAALEILQGGILVDLLFTDVVMPGGMDGRALAAAARRLRPKLKVLFTSGFTAAAASAATDSSFGANLLSKPYRREELARRIRAALDVTEI